MRSWRLSIRLTPSPASSALPLLSRFSTSASRSSRIHRTSTCIHFLHGSSRTSRGYWKQAAALPCFLILFPSWIGQKHLSIAMSIISRARTHRQRPPERSLLIAPTEFFCKRSLRNSKRLGLPYRAYSHVTSATPFPLSRLSPRSLRSTCRASKGRDQGAVCFSPKQSTCLPLSKTSSSISLSNFPAQANLCRSSIHPPIRHFLKCKLSISSHRMFP
mmetsp:Transcript_27110/g.44229  ORF Transcript_27110/g.44229 Transcript_27110/m.44229 type:complete len:217 (+) Transcript_27110:685-1335(+)